MSINASSDFGSETETASPSSTVSVVRYDARDNDQDTILGSYPAEDNALTGAAISAPIPMSSIQTTLEHGTPDPDLVMGEHIPSPGSRMSREPDSSQTSTLRWRPEEEAPAWAVELYQVLSKKMTLRHEELLTLKQQELLKIDQAVKTMKDNDFSTGDNLSRLMRAVINGLDDDLTGKRDLQVSMYNVREHCTSLFEEVQRSAADHGSDLKLDISKLSITCDNIQENTSSVQDGQQQATADLSKLSITCDDIHQGMSTVQDGQAKAASDLSRLSQTFEERHNMLTSLGNDQAQIAANIARLSQIVEEREKLLSSIESDQAKVAAGISRLSEAFDEREKSLSSIENDQAQIAANIARLSQIVEEREKLLSSIESDQAKVAAGFSRLSEAFDEREKSLSKIEDGQAKAAVDISKLSQFFDDYQRKLSKIENEQARARADALAFRGAIMLSLQTIADRLGLKEDPSVEMSDMDEADDEKRDGKRPAYEESLDTDDTDEMHPSKRLAIDSDSGSDSKKPSEHWKRRNTRRSRPNF